MTDQDRHAQYAIAAMRELLAKANLDADNVLHTVASDASTIADVMLDKHLARFAGEEVQGAPGPQR